MLGFDKMLRVIFAKVTLEHSSKIELNIDLFQTLLIC